VYVKENGDELKFLVDTGTNRNYIAPRHVKKSVRFNPPFKAQTPAGSVDISEKISGKFFEKLGDNSIITFFILPTLTDFDGILGDDTLKAMGAVVDRKYDILRLDNGACIYLKNSVIESLDHLVNESVSDVTKNQIDNLIKKYKNLFSPISDKETVRTNVRAEIKTTTNEPIYCKGYPYPFNMREEVERQVKEMLSEGVIRSSKSPYNSPIWVVEKKPKPNGEKQYRMVNDYKRLNAVTIPDTYPIPDITATLASLGNAKFFTTIDLTSGFHQILMKDADIPKTAFSTLNGKYEYLRLPFGLRNAPAIFQRMIDDVLKEHIGRICYVYIDDIIVFGENQESHLRNLETIFSCLNEAGLKVNLEKTHFMDTEVEFLGYVISPEGIRPDPKKIQAIRLIAPPETLKELKRFLGLTSYYRKFIRDYAKIAKPLTNLTRGENAQVSARKSKNVPITLDSEALQAFESLKELLTSPEILCFPDFNKPFNLTTDASNLAIGAVLSQGEIGSDKPIAFISRSLKKAEENYATNEKEMLAIVWALDNLRSYLYGAKKIKIYTDHQPLTYSLGNRNYNAKLKRWKARIEEYNHELIYKPGKSNFVADALSRLKTQVINNITNSGSSTDTASEGATRGSETDTASECTMHSADQDSSDLIPHVEVPINVFRNQIIFGGNLEIYLQPHPGYHRYYIPNEKSDRDSIIKELREKLRPNILNGIKCPENRLALLQDIYLNHFENYKIRFTQRIVEDLQNPDHIYNIIMEEHKRAHRNPSENKQQILERYYFPQMNALVKKFTAECETCKRNKYDRHPSNPLLKATPIPRYACEILHVDILNLQGEKFISVLDKFSKFAKLFHIKNRSTLHLREKMIKILHYFTAPRIMVTDNEGGFLSPLVQNYLESLGIKIYRTPSQRSEVNGQVERFHSTFMEIFRCIKEDFKDLKFKELVSIAVDRYNNSVHSVTNRKPSDIFFNRSERINFQKLLDFKAKVNNDLRAEIRRKQSLQLLTHNKKRQSPNDFKKGDIIYVKNKQIKGKHKALYNKEIVAKNNSTTVITKSGKKIYKAHIRNVRGAFKKKSTPED